MGKLQQNKQENRARILDAAFRLFAEKGLENTRISDIVRLSGLARGTFYNYFSSVEEIWFAVTAEFQEQVSKLAQEARRKASEPLSFIQDAYLITFNVFSSRPEALQLLAKNQMATRSAFLTGPGVASVLESLEQDMIESGFFPNLSPEQIALASFAMVGAAFEVLAQCHDRGIALDPEKLSRELAQLFLSGMRGMDQTGT